MTNALGNPTRYEVYHYEIPFSGLKECDFKGMKVKVPDNTQEYLRTLYGEDFESGETFETLLEDILKIDGLKRVRIGSVYPDKITDRFIELFKNKNLI